VCVYVCGVCVWCVCVLDQSIRIRYKMGLKKFFLEKTGSVWRVTFYLPGGGGEVLAHARHVEESAVDVAPPDHLVD
jgi:hypothetical protein